MSYNNSRGTAPPGGNGSDIFAPATNYVPPQPSTLSGQRAAANMSSSVFAGPVDAGQQQRPQQQQQQQQQYQQQLSPQAQAAGGSGSQSNMGGYGSYDITGKPTSRVLAPPGGGSSISFGGPPPTQAAYQQPTGLAAQRAAANSSSSVFGGPTQSQQQYQQPQQQQYQQPQQQQQQFQPQQQQQQSQQQQQQQFQPQAAGGSASQQNMGGYGSYDITGKPSSRVLAPPGGATSNNIFGGGPAQPPQQQQPQGIASQRAAQGLQSSVFAGPTEAQPQRVHQNQQQLQHDGQANATGPALPRPSTRVHAPPGGGSQITFG